ncbi:S66 peptidase family protein [Phycisphaerales bacterium AB-hyl4]|uniref:S66 peptidase family protein n=1 Tax=Natronomicrosphaera hydrolytica TaxID=3242702 RepID=A0ABV4UAT4_9BACT
MIKPKKLRHGDRIAAISLSWGGPGKFPHRYEAGKRQLQEAFDVEVVETRHALRDPDWLHRNPKARADDLMEAFANPAINGIVSTIGGDDSIRLLPHVDPEVIRSNPKVLMGYSDTTITHWMCFHAGLVTFYGPSVMAGFAENGGIFPYTRAAVHQALFSAQPLGPVAPNDDGWTVERLDWAVPENQHRPRELNPSEPWQFLQGQGVVEGRLVGGCLEVVECMRGTPFWLPDAVWDDAILFLETSQDAPPPSTMKSALRSYASMGFLSKLAGILVGRPGGGVPPQQFEQYEQAILQVVAEEEGLTHLPILTRMDFGHTDPMFVLPYGVLAQIDCAQRTFSILENAVVE